MTATVTLGLTTQEVEQRRREYGDNTLPSAKRTSAWGIFFNQFKNPLVYIILAAAGISLAVGEYGDFGIIMAVVLIDAVLGFIQEYQAQRTYTALKSLLKPTTTVIRDGMRQEVEVSELVPDDIVVLNAGERIPGDGQVLEALKLTVEEAILTGESEPVNKTTAAGENQVFMGTTVLTGRGLMRVTTTGARTELGHIATSLHEEIEDKTPLQVRLEAFSRTLTRLVLAITAAIFIVGLISGRPLLEMLRVSIILAIAAVPEGLLIAVTVILVLGMRKILKRNGLVKRLLAVETLGSVTTICTDKTGTLTEGRMQVTRCAVNDPQRALEVMVYCNDLEGPVDAALWEYARKELGHDPQEMAERAERLGEELFSSETKFMIAASRIAGQTVHYLKGAPEIVLGMCTVSDEERERVLAQVEGWAGEGLRLLGLAYRLDGLLGDHSGYTWIGLVAMEDPIREGVREAIQIARTAGIQVKMITGDYRKTAERIAAMIGLVNRPDQVLDGEDLQRLSDEELAARVQDIAVFARIRPQDKLRIVRALQSRGEITAMIGDGVNDAPALKRANIGVVVGAATDVAKETADLILLDNNFKTIVAAVEEGRVIFENIRKVVAYTLSNSFAEVLLVFGAMLLGWPAPLLVAQILWIHLICDGPSDIVLGFEPKENGIMEEPPKPLNEPILNRLGLSLIAIISIVSAVAGLSIFGHYFLQHNNPAEGRSIAFASFALNSMVYIFAYRSMRRPLFRMNRLSANKPLIWAVVAGQILVVLPFLVPKLRQVLSIVPLHLEDWLLVVGVALSLLATVEIGKWITNRRHHTKTPVIS
ncbi:MAG TPA: cation-translocating P-type ATPase [Anaerolineae bacterium]|nr:cation-translocating P-type ATPase [Anaerolineae bacterium]HQK15087.1 cation-translocating P-type ATPase [Anaerolineae bacterium]